MGRSYGLFWKAMKTNLFCYFCRFSWSGPKLVHFGPSPLSCQPDLVARTSIILLFIICMYYIIILFEKYTLDLKQVQVTERKTQYSITSNNFLNRFTLFWITSGVHLDRAHTNRKTHLFQHQFVQPQTN